MGYILSKLIILILQVLKTVGDGTIWVIKKLFLVLFTLLVALGKVGYLPIIIVQKCFSFLKAGIRISTERITAITNSPTSVVKPNLNRAIGRKNSGDSFTRLRKLWFATSYFLIGFVVAATILGSYSAYYILSSDLPHPELLTKRDIPLTTKIYDRNGELLYEIYADQNRTPVDLAELPEHFVDATIAIEDQGFYRHQGFSPRGIVRAAYSIMVNDEIQGGSTITQQLVRSALLNRDITFSRKARELILSVWTEQLYSKEEILSMYFNQVPYGGTAWGAEAAAQTFFGKSIRDVSLAEAALIAGLPAAPTTFSPFGSRPDLAIARQHEVLRRMEEEGFITADERTQAEEEEITFSYTPTGIRAPHFVMYVRQVLSERYGPRMVEQGGLIVHTTLDLEIQEKVQEIVSSRVDSLQPLQVGNGAVVVTDPKTGEILAMVGSRDYFDDEHDGNVNIALTPQQPGSTIKVVTYTTALQHGYTAATLINDSPITYTAQGSSPYSPVNYDGKFHGMVTLRNALGNSFNIPAVRALADVGLPAMIEQGRKMGIDSWKHTENFGLSLTLGGGEVTMLDMAEVYGTLVNNGVHNELTPVIAITDHVGNTINFNKNRKPVQAVPAEVAYIMADILSDNSARTTAFGPNSDLSIPNQWVGVKTGTSNDKRDNWAIGFTKDFTVVAWVGNNDNTPMHPTLSSGITGATPIWRDVTDLLLEKYPSTKPTAPTSIIAQQCRGRQEYFIAGSDITSACRQIQKPVSQDQSDRQEEV